MKILFTPKVAKTQNGSTEGRVNGRAGIIFFLGEMMSLKLLKTRQKAQNGVTY